MEDNCSQMAGHKKGKHDKLSTFRWKHCKSFGVGNNLILTKPSPLWGMLARCWPVWARSQARRRSPVPWQSHSTDSSAPAKKRLQGPGFQLRTLETKSIEVTFPAEFLGWRMMENDGEFLDVTELKMWRMMENASDFLRCHVYWMDFNLRPGHRRGSRSASCSKSLRRTGNGPCAIAARSNCKL